jgi:K+-transporting ATPase KdpF subunit
MLQIALVLSTIGNESAQKAVSNGNTAYLAGIIIAVFIFGYLVYSLLKPEKF